MIEVRFTPVSNMFLRSFGLALMLMSGFVGVGLYASGKFESSTEIRGMRTDGICVKFTLKEFDVLPTIPVGVSFLAGLVCALLPVRGPEQNRDAWRSKWNWQDLERRVRDCGG
jgi:hypothetical protein